MHDFWLIIILNNIVYIILIGWINIKHHCGLRDNYFYIFQPISIIMLSYEEHGRFNRAITMVAGTALDSDGCLGLSSSTRHSAIIFHWAGIDMPWFTVLVMIFIFISSACIFQCLSKINKACRCLLSACLCSETNN